MSRFSNLHQLMNKAPSNKELEEGVNKFNEQDDMSRLGDVGVQRNVPYGALSDMVGDEETSDSVSPSFLQPADLAFPLVSKLGGAQNKFKNLNAVIDNKSIEQKMIDALRRDASISLADKKAAARTRLKILPDKE